MSNSPTAFGQIINIGPIETKSEKFRCRNVILRTDLDSQYPQEVQFQLSQDRCDLIEKYNIAVGQSVTISYNLRGRKWDDPKTGTPKWFNTLDAWRIEAAQAEPTDIASQFPTEAPAESTDLPF
jgi:hypothetical protein